MPVGVVSRKQNRRLCRLPGLVFSSVNELLNLFLTPYLRMPQLCFGLTIGQRVHLSVQHFDWRGLASVFR